jgi:hypothetical protein
MVGFTAVASRFSYHACTHLYDEIHEALQALQKDMANCVYIYNDPIYGLHAQPKVF